MSFTVEQAGGRVAMAIDGPELVTIGRFAKPQGRFGELAVNPCSDSPERFVELSRLFLERPGAAAEEFMVESMRLHKGRPILKLEGVSSIDEALVLADRSIGIPVSELDSAPDDTYYHYEFVGLEAHDDCHGFIGSVTEILSTGGTDVVVVAGPDGSEILLPLCTEICRRVDLESRRLEVHCPDGLLDINLHAR